MSTAYAAYPADLSHVDIGSISQVAGNLIEIGSELFSKGFNDEAMDMLDAAFHLLRTPSVEVNRIATKQLQCGSQRLLSEDLPQQQQESEQPLPDIYQEDECDVGPRVLKSPVRMDAATCLAGNTALIEAFVVFNKALVLHEQGNFSDTKALYEVIVCTVQNLLLNVGLQMSTNKMLEMGLRAHNNLGELNYLDGREEIARSHFEAAVIFAEQLASLSKEYRLEYATVLSNWCRVCWMRGDIGETLYRGMREVLRIRSSLLPWDHVDVAAAHYNVGVAEYARQRGDKAHSHFMQYLQIASHLASQQTTAATLDAIPALIHLLLLQNEDKEDSMSLELVRGLRTLQDKRQDQGPHSTDVASVLNFIGTLLFHKEDFENALLFFEEELRLEEQLSETNEDISVSVTCNNIGRILQELGRSHDAIYYYQRALKSEYGDVSHQKNGDKKSKYIKLCSYPKTSNVVLNSPATANLYSTVWYNLGLIHDKLGSYADAINAFQMSLDLRKAMLGSDHPDIACLLYNIGVLQMEQHLLKDATFSFREALRIRRVASTGQLNDRHIVKTLEKLASLHKAKGDIQGALEASREVLVIMEASDDYSTMARDRDMGVVLRSITELYHAIGDVAAGLEMAQESVRKLQSVVHCHEVKGLLADFSVKFTDVEQLVSSLLLVGSLHHEASEPVQACGVFEQAAAVIQRTKTSCTSVPASLNTLLEVTLMLGTSHCAPEA